MKQPGTKNAFMDKEWSRLYQDEMKRPFGNNFREFMRGSNKKMYKEKWRAEIARSWPNCNMKEINNRVFKEYYEKFGKETTKTANGWINSSKNTPPLSPQTSALKSPNPEKPSQVLLLLQFTIVCIF